MIIGNKERILILAPHTDDGELGAGGSISKWVRQGHDVYYVAFSICQSSIPDGWPSDILASEVIDATSELGIARANLVILEYEVRRFSSRRQDILDDLVNIKKDIDPSVVLMPAEQDLHQDHYTVYCEGLRAFKDRTILCYEIPWNNISFGNKCFSILSKRDVEKKVDALKKYKSQGHRSYLSADYLRSQMVFRGTQIGVEYAEVFDCIRSIIR